jgi:tetratricopeptide (TPR) repeat protein
MDGQATKEQLLELYEARDDPDTFVKAKRLYEQALAGAEAADAGAHIGYGYLLECHGRRALRQAVERYERAIELDPDAEHVHYQLISGYAALKEPERPVALYQRRLAAAPAGVREHRFLASAYLAARDHPEAGRVIAAGLALAPDDRVLLEFRGEVRAATGDPDGALDDWRRAVDPDGNIGPVYSSAFLLEREGRLEEAVAAWQSIIDWCEAHDAPLTAEWPRQELARLRGRLSGA